MEYEPIYVVDYLRSYPTLVELWEENDALYKEMPSLSIEETSIVKRTFLMSIIRLGRHVIRNGKKYGISVQSTDSLISLCPMEIRKGFKISTGRQ